MYDDINVKKFEAWLATKDLEELNEINDLLESSQEDDDDCIITDYTYDDDIA